MDSNVSQENKQRIIPQTSGMAIASLVFGILGFFLYFTSILAIIFGHISLSKINKSNGTLNGKGLAIAGLVTGYITLVMFIGIIAAVVLPKLAAVQEDAKHAQELYRQQEQQKQHELLQDIENNR